MVRKRLYAKQTASVEYEQIDLFSLLEEEQRQTDRTAEQVDLLVFDRGGLLRV